MKLQTAQRKRARIKMGLQGPSGSGKTFSALLLAYGLCNDWSKVAVVDTENHSSELYAHLGPFQVLPMRAPFTPERYMQAMEACEAGGIEVIIIDSATHEWEELLDHHSKLPGNSFTNWGKITPRHNAFVQRVLQSPTHVICTIRTKQDYVLNEKNGKMTPEKVGLKGVQRDGIEYELTLVFDLDIKNLAVASKDRTGLFFGKPEQRLSVETGLAILEWCNTGADITAHDVSGRIGDCRSIQELLELYQEYPQFQGVLKPEFEQHKRRIMINQEAQKELANQNLSTNGTDHS
ncbi:AAA family ATPase [Flaviaesturariibacter aridisoli]|uniref:AAA family ATPase n=1 Tax=Flaviaesturariibacter aridisoli TaxID=2545761 RepID=A0A4R4E6H4_9BACT|nr:AAA family ATPase [Flaviaesturariibacter aridisoli]TCZ73285.1 AAA family ATPase [Flaviaesturariibacter aridisoli]